MRFRRAIPAAAVLTGCLSIGHRPSVSAPTPADPVLDIYDQVNSRALKCHKLPVDPSIIKALHDSPITADYNKINPKRSILLYDCTDFNCWQDYLSVQNIFTVAARAVNPLQPDAEGLAQSWYTLAKGLDSTLCRALTYTTLDALRFQLLAVANRMDMASWDDKHKYWSGAEIHFVYGLTPTAGQHDLTIIFEFELATDRMTGFSRPDFKDLAKLWSGLSAVPNVPATAYPDALKAALRGSGLPLYPGDTSWIKSVRLRINHAINGGQWQLTQLLLDPKAGPKFAPAKLNNQLGDIPSSDLYSLWVGALAAIGLGLPPYEIPEYLGNVPMWEQPTREYTNDYAGMGTPQGICGTTPKAVTTRNVLAIQQCTLCHTSESAAPFAHIRNRAAYETSSTVSGFLLGKDNGKNIHPYILALYSGDENVVWKVDVPYDTYTGSGCTTLVNPRPTVSIKFHDVARRTLFLAEVLNDSLLPVNATPRAQRLSSHSIE